VAGRFEVSNTKKAHSHNAQSVERIEEAGTGEFDLLFPNGAGRIFADSSQAGASIVDGDLELPVKVVQELTETIHPCPSSC
jgi:hypothetical protein